VATQLCDAVGVPHILLDHAASRFKAEMTKNLKTNFCADEHAQMPALADYIAGRYRTVYDGIAGDVLSNGLFLDATRLALFEEGRFADLAENIFRSFPMGGGFNHETLVAKLLPPDQYRRFSREAAMSALTAELRRHADAPNPVGSFFFHNRTRREVSLSPLCLFGEAAQVFCPYLDHELYDLLVSLPARMFLSHSFHTETIRQTYPRYAHVPFDNEVIAPRAEAGAHFRRFGRELAWYALTHGRSPYVRYSYLLPRLFKCGLDGKYGETFFSWRFFGPHALYLLQLGAHADPGRRREQGQLDV
jgi:hypothetical protein